MVKKLIIEIEHTWAEYSDVDELAEDIARWDRSGRLFSDPAKQSELEINWNCKDENNEREKDG